MQKALSIALFSLAALFSVPMAHAADCRTSFDASCLAPDAETFQSVPTEAEPDSFTKQQELEQQKLDLEKERLETEIELEQERQEAEEERFEREIACARERAYIIAEDFTVLRLIAHLECLNGPLTNQEKKEIKKEWERWRR